MTRESKEEEVVESAAEKKPKITLVLILSLVIGVLVTLLIGGSIYHVQSRKALVAELAATKAELKQKTALFSDLQEQIAGLSRQMHALKEFSVTKAYAVAAATPGSEAPAAEPAPPPPARSEAEAKKQEAVSATPAKKEKKKETEKEAEKAKEKAPQPTAAPASTTESKAGTSEPVARKAKPAPLDCQIVGKSPEEQMATLQRCTQAMDRKR